MKDVSTEEIYVMSNKKRWTRILQSQRVPKRTSEESSKKYEKYHLN